MKEARKSEGVGGESGDTSKVKNLEIKLKDCNRCFSRWEESTERAEKEAEVAHL